MAGVSASEAAANVDSVDVVFSRSEEPSSLCSCLDGSSTDSFTFCCCLRFRRIDGARGGNGASGTEYHGNWSTVNDYCVRIILCANFTFG